MGTQITDSVDDERFRIPAVTWAASIGAGILGGSALVGWGIESHLLKQLVPGLPSMRPATAVALILLAIAVISFLRRPRLRWVGASATAVVGLIAGVCLLEYALDVNLVLDRLLFPDAIDREPNGGRMALATAVELALMASAILAATLDKHRAAQCLGMLVFTVAAVAVLGYAYGERRLYAAEALTGMALNTALGLTLVAVGLLAAIPDGAFTHLFRAPAPGALLSRRLLPWITIVMPVIGWLRIEGEHRGWFGPALGTSIMVFAGSILVTITARMAVVTMDRLAASLNHAWHQYGLISANEQTQSALNQTPALSSDLRDLTIETEENLQQAPHR